MNSGTQTNKRVLMLLPSLRISGGVKEAIRLAEDLNDRGNDVEIVVLWKNKQELPCTKVRVRYLSNFVAKRSVAGPQFLLLLIRFFFFLQRHVPANNSRQMALILTHFSTFPFAWIASRFDWYCFNQDVEWMFVKAGLRRAFLRWIILATSRRSRVITTNAFVESLYLQEGIKAIGRLSIWASITWLTGRRCISRDIDVLMLLRRGHMKRLDLYLEIVGRIARGGLTSCVVTPDLDIFEHPALHGTQRVLRPNDEELKDIYRRSKSFLLLSDTEGFGLPPLEAMGSGCVPLCRDCGGPRCYMTGPLAANLIPLNAPSAEVFATLQRLLGNPDKLLALSEFAVDAFSNGYASSVRERNEFLKALSETLRIEA